MKVNYKNKVNLKNKFFFEYKSYPLSKYYEINLDKLYRWLSLNTVFDMLL